MRGQQKSPLVPTKAKQGDTMSIPRICNVEGCNDIGSYRAKYNKYVLRRGMCTKHYMRVLRYGDPDVTIINPPGTFKVCVEDNCNKKPKGRGLCMNHIARETALKKPLYNTWRMMKQRCYNPNYTHYSYYGGRGIKVCEEWLHNFESFLEEVGPRPKGTTLDRIDNNGDYEPGNVRWATAKEQQANTRPKRKKARIGLLS